MKKIGLVILGVMFCMNVWAEGEKTPTISLVSGDQYLNFVPKVRIDIPAQKPIFIQNNKIIHSTNDLKQGMYCQLTFNHEPDEQGKISDYKFGKDVSAKPLYLEKGRVIQSRYSHVDYDNDYKASNKSTRVDFSFKGDKSFAMFMCNVGQTHPSRALAVLELHVFGKLFNVVEPPPEKALKFKKQKSTNEAAIADKNVKPNKGDTTGYGNKDSGAGADVGKAE